MVYGIRIFLICLFMIIWRLRYKLRCRKGEKKFNKKEKERRERERERRREKGSEKEIYVHIGQKERKYNRQKDTKQWQLKDR